MRYNGVNAILVSQMKCSKCGLEVDDAHSPEYYSACRSCVALWQQRKYASERVLTVERAPGQRRLSSDNFCESCGKLLNVPSRYCCACEKKRTGS